MAQRNLGLPILPEIQSLLREVAVKLGRILLVLVSLTVVGAAWPALTGAQGGPCSPRTPQYCPPPKVTVGPAKQVTSTAATLTGTVNPNGSATSCWFEYGRTSAYGSRTPVRSVGSGSKSKKLSARITGLTPGTVYDYELACRNLGGQASQGPANFRTQSEVSFRGSSTISVSRSGMLSVALHCRGHLRCVGSLTLTGMGGKRLARRVRYSVRPRRTAHISMRLTRRTRRRLSRRHHLTGWLHARGHDGSSARRRVQLHERRAA